jgi:hypothetical protein
LIDLEKEGRFGVVLFLFVLVFIYLFGGVVYFVIVTVNFETGTHCAAQAILELRILLLQSLDRKGVFEKVLHSPENPLED